jgi:hypothetical protein
MSSTFLAVSCTLIITVLLLTLARVSAVRVRKGGGIIHSTVKPLLFMTGVLILFYLANQALIAVLVNLRVPEETALLTALLVDDFLAMMWLLAMYRRNGLRQSRMQR